MPTFTGNNILAVKNVCGRTGELLRVCKGGNGSKRAVDSFCANGGGALMRHECALRSNSPLNNHRLGCLKLLVCERFEERDERTLLRSRQRHAAVGVFGEVRIKRGTALHAGA